VEVQSVTREKLYSYGVQALAVGLGVAAVSIWVAAPAGVRIEKSLPGMDGRKVVARAGGGAEAKVSFKAMDGRPSEMKGAWPRFRGADLSNVADDGVKLVDSWPETGPSVVWSVDLGEGHAGAAIWKGRAFVLDHDETRKADLLRCLSMDDGRDIWQRWYDLPLKRNHGISRTIPSVTDSHLVTIGPRCHVMCVRPDSGDLVWMIDMVERYGTTVPGWYAGQCPLIDGGVVVLAPGGTNVLVTGLDIETGEAMWETPNPGGWNMSHSSIAVMEHGGRRMYVYVAIGGTVGIAADGDDAGSILWKSTEWQPSVVAPSPVPFDGGRVFLTAGYGAGSAMLKIAGSGGTFDAGEPVVRKAREWLACEQQTPIHYGGMLFGIMPKDGGALRNQFVCYNPNGDVVWSSGKENRFGMGPFIIADGKIFILDDEGRLTMCRASTDKYDKLAEAKVLPGVDSWAPFAIADGRMVLRDSTKMICLDLRAGQGGGRGVDNQAGGH